MEASRPGYLGSWALAFDLLASEYGYTDEQILETPIRRIRQQIDAINFRRDIRDRVRRAELEWVTSMLAQFISCTVPGGDELREVAEGLKMLAEEDLDVATPEVPSGVSPQENGAKKLPPGLDFDPADPDRIPEGAKVPSWEKLQSMFGTKGGPR